MVLPPFEEAVRLQRTVRACDARALCACEPLKLLLRHTKAISGFREQKNDCFAVLVCVEGWLYKQTCLLRPSPAPLRVLLYPSLK